MSALPEWPDPLPPTPFDIRLKLYYQRDLADAALARLRAVAPYMRHRINCESKFRECTCGLSELLADLLPPGEGR